MNKRKAFTLIELLVVISILSLLMAILLPALARAREAGKRAVCVHDIGQLMVVWNTYAEENEDKLAGVYTTKCVCLSGVYPTMDCTVNPPKAKAGTLNETLPIKHHSFPSWVEHPHQWDTTTEPSDGSKHDPHRYDLMPNGATVFPPAPDYDYTPYCLNVDNDFRHAIACGTFWKYLKDYKIYRCPNSEKNVWVSYIGADGLNGIHNSGGWCNEGAGSTTNYKIPSVFMRSQVKRPSERMVYLCYGAEYACSWNVINTQKTMTSGCWSSNPPVRHSNGTCIGFADAHVEYHKWYPRALEINKNKCVDWTTCPVFPCSSYGCDKDLFYMAKGICGTIGGTDNQDTVVKAITDSGCKIEW